MSVKHYNSQAELDNSFEYLVELKESIEDQKQEIVEQEYNIENLAARLKDEKEDLQNLKVELDRLIELEKEAIE